jgi:hypothetical protein
VSGPGTGRMGGGLGLVLGMIMVYTRSHDSHTCYLSLGESKCF